MGKDHIVPYVSEFQNNKGKYYYSRDFSREQYASFCTDNTLSPPKVRQKGK